MERNLLQLQFAVPEPKKGETTSVFNKKLSDSKLPPAVSLPGVAPVVANNPTQ
jgi:hypothetical protein